MKKFSLAERFRLELCWDNATYEKDGVCRLSDAKFRGPALSEAIQLNDNDHMLLDFFKQYYVLVKAVYVAKFSWGQVKYNTDGTISLEDALITHDTELNKVPTFKSSDYLVIDTSDHEIESHPFNPVYRTYVVNETTSLYRFGE